MIRKLSIMLTDMLHKQNMIEEEYFDIYAYGLEVFFDFIIKTILLLVAGAAFKMFIPTVIYIVSFASLRMYSGGYHSKTRIGCLVVTILMWISAMMFTRYIVVNVYETILLLTIAMFVFIRYTPVENDNKRIEDEQKQLFRKKSICILAIQILIMCLQIACEIEIYSIIYISILEVTALIVTQKVLIRKGSEHYEESTKYH